MSITTAETWLVGYVARSRLTQHFFDLRERFGHDISDEMEWIASTFLLGRCLFFAAALALRNGREHLVAFHNDRGLVHAVFACAPQVNGNVLAGDYVDAVTRGKLSSLREDLSGFAGDLTVSVGDLPDHDTLSETEARKLTVLAGALPWTRPFSGEPRAELASAVADLKLSRISDKNECDG